MHLVQAGVRGLDIGTGASAVYPLLGHCEYGWSFLGESLAAVHWLQPAHELYVLCTHPPQMIRTVSHKGMLNRTVSQKGMLIPTVSHKGMLIPTVSRKGMLIRTVSQS